MVTTEPWSQYCRLAYCLPGHSTWANLLMVRIIISIQCQLRLNRDHKEQHRSANGIDRKSVIPFLLLFYRFSSSLINLNTFQLIQCDSNCKLSLPVEEKSFHTRTMNFEHGSCANAWRARVECATECWHIEMMLARFTLLSFIVMMMIIM